MDWFCAIKLCSSEHWPIRYCLTCWRRVLLLIFSLLKDLVLLLIWSCRTLAWSLVSWAASLASLIWQKSKIYFAVFDSQNHNRNAINKFQQLHFPKQAKSKQVKSLVVLLTWTQIRYPDLDPDHHFEFLTDLTENWRTGNTLQQTVVLPVPPL